MLIQKNLTADISEEYVIDCTFSDINVRCGGGSPVVGLLLLNLTGGPTEAQYPYYQGTYGNTDQEYVAAGMCNTTSSYIKT